MASVKRTGVGALVEGSKICQNYISSGLHLNMTHFWNWMFPSLGARVERHLLSWVSENELFSTSGPNM